MLNLLTRLLSPKEVTFRKGALSRLRFLTGSRAILLCGNESLEKFGHLAKIQALLQAAKFEVSIYKNIHGDPTTTSVDTCAKAMLAFNPDWIIACGGGAVIDTAKLAWVFYEHPSITWENLQKSVNSLPLRQKAKLCAIPTTSGTGSEVSIVAVVKNDEKNSKIPIVSPELLPDVVILDPVLTLELPATITVYTALDAFTHALEAFCSKIHNPLTDGYAIMAARMIIENLQKVVEFPADIEGREKLLYAAMLAGQAQNITSVGAIHALAHTIGAAFNIPHGLSNALFLPAIVQLNAQSSDRPTLFAEKIGFDSLHELVKWVKKIMLSVSLPLNWRKAAENTTSIDISLLAQKAKDDICMRTNPRSLTITELTTVLEEVSFSEL